MKILRRVSLGLVGLFVWVTGCSSYEQIQIADAADHSRVRVILTGGERFRLYDPIVGVDSITGHEKPEGKRYAGNRIQKNREGSSRSVREPARS